jgi:hypothetical protein
MNAHVMELRLLGAQTGFDIPKTFPTGKLGKRHREILISAGECLDLVIALVTMNATPERVHRQVIHDLRKDELARVHVGGPPAAEMRQKHCEKHDLLSKP